MERVSVGSLQTGTSRPNYQIPNWHLALMGQELQIQCVDLSLTSNERFPREVIQDEFLAALNSIFGSDGQFSEIQVQVHDEVQEEEEADKGPLGSLSR